MKTSKNFILHILFFSCTIIMHTSIITSSLKYNAQTQSQTTHTSTASHPLFTSTMPTTSINEKAIDTIYGKNGLNINQIEIMQIKQTYAYIEMIIKSHKIASDPTLIKYKAFFEKMIASNRNNSTLITQEMLNSNEWKAISITNADIENSDTWQLYLKSAIVDYYDNQYDFIETISMVQDQIFPYLANIELNFYNNNFIQLRKLAELLRAKKMLQDRTLQQHLQACADWKGKNQATINTLVAAFKTTDFYRYTHDTTTWTTASKNLGHPLEEYVMTYFMLTTIQSSIQNNFTQKNLLSFLTQASSTISPNFFYYLPIDFVNLDYILTLQAQLKKNKTTSNVSQLQSFDVSDLVDISKIDSQNVIIQKSNNPFSNIGHDISHVAHDTGKGITNTAKNAVDTAKDTGKGLKQIMKATKKDIDVKDIDSALVDTSTAINLGAQGVGVGAAGSAALSVGVITGDKSATQWGKKENKIALRQMKESGKDFNKAISTLSKMALFSTITHGVEGMALGAAGFGATMIGDIIYAQTGNKSIKNWGKKESKKAIDDLQAAGQDVNTVIDNTAKALEDGIVAPIALVAGNATGFVIQDKKIGQDMTIIMNQVCDSAINLGATTLTSVNNIVNTAFVSIYKLSELFREVMVDAIMVVYGETTGQTTVANRSVAMTTTTAKNFVKNIAQAATSNFSCIMTSTMDIVMGAAAVMAAVTNSITTIIFDTVREITFLGAGLGELMGAPVNAEQERNKISAKMEAHRSTINIATSVVLMVALTVVTFGAAAPEAGAVLSADIGGEAIAETTTVALSDTATTATVETSGGLTEGTGSATRISTLTSEESTQAATGDMVAVNAEKGAQISSEEVAGMSTEEGGGQTSLATEAGAKNASFLAVYGGEMLGQTINLIFSAFSIISADNQDEAARKMLAQEKASIMNLWKFIEDNKVVMTHNQNLYLDELHKKHQFVIENQNFGLNYYTNYLNSSINNIQSQISHALSEEYIGMLTPDSNGSRMADIGSTWGLITPFIYLYPSQGFLTTTLGRSDFPYAQEIAQAPLVALKQDPTTKTDDLNNTKKESLKSWFNQRAVAHVKQAPTAPLFVEIKFRVIYNLTSDFYIGLYLGGKYYDYYSPEYLADIQNTGGIHLDDAHLAKMFVLKRENNEKTPSLGIYENEGKGWITQKTIDQKILNNSSIYHMSATLNKNKLTVAFWPENNPSAKWSSTVLVTPSDQRTFGIIFSGAAIEWDVIKPTMPIQQNSNVRTALNNLPETNRERAAKKLWETLKNPTFGSMKLTSIGTKYLIQGQYLYTTQDTKLTDKNNNFISDTLAFATYVSGDLSNIGISPITTNSTEKPNVVISMISGNVYDDNSNIIDTKQDPWPLFMRNNGPFDQALTASITSAQKQILIKPTALESTSNTIIALDDITKNISPTTGGFQFGLSNKVPATKIAPQSFEQRQSKAAQGATVQVGGLDETVSMDNMSIESSGFSL